jgi:hypothetical protein
MKKFFKGFPCKLGQLTAIAYNTSRKPVIAALLLYLLKLVAASAKSS